MGPWFVSGNDWRCALWLATLVATVSSSASPFLAALSRLAENRTSKSCAPLPASLASAFMAWCVLSDRLTLGVLIGLGFHCLLRTGELLFLQLEHVKLGDSSAILNLKLTKSGRCSRAFEAVTVSDAGVLTALRTLCEIRAVQYLPGRLCLLPVCTSKMVLPISLPSDAQK